MIEQLIQTLNLQPHPEGGFFRETFRSKLEINVDGKGLRNAMTSILYLLPQGDQSKFHRIQSDEMWHFYQGGPLKILEIDANGNLNETILGPNPDKHQKLQYCVAARTWFAAAPLEQSSYCLVGCDVSPGFDFQDFEMASESQLKQQFPQHEAVIRAFT